MSRDERMPRDPFEPDEVSALGLIGEIVGEGGLLLDALREARARGALLDAVLALDVRDLRAVVIERLVTEAFRDAFRGSGAEREP